MKVACEHCGLPFSVPRVAPGKAVYCCSGCALAARVPVDAQGQFPVNAALVTALSAGFVFFNQAMFWMLSLLLARRADAASATNAGRFAVASLALGGATWAALAFFQTRAGARRAVDQALIALSGVVLGWAVSRGRAEIALGANLVLATWALRGLARKKASAKKQA
jgi:hypothetical protein